MPERNHSKGKPASPKKHRNTRRKKEPAVIPDWKPHLSSYREKSLLRFENDEALDAAIDMLWTDAFFTLPHATPDGRSIIVPSEAVEQLARAGLKFTATRMQSISDLTPEEIAKLRR